MAPDARWRTARDDVGLLFYFPLEYRRCSDTQAVGTIVEQARRAHSELVIVARTRSDAERQHLMALGATHTILGERELALEMVRISGLDRTDEAAPVTTGPPKAGYRFW